MNEHTERLHLKAVSISFDQLAELLRGTGHFFRVQVADSLPVDARPLYASCDLLRREVTIIFEHESFPQVADGSVLWNEHARFEWRFPIDPEISPLEAAGRWDG